MKKYDDQLREEMLDKAERTRITKQMVSVKEPEGEPPTCSMSMASGNPTPCRFDCAICVPLMLWRIAARGVDVGGEITTYSSY